jgi:hypothetical protein
MKEVYSRDCHELVEKLAGAPGSSVEFIIGEGRMHDWVIIPFGESKKDLGQITRFLFVD